MNEPRKFCARRLELATQTWRKAGLLTADETLTIESTVSRRYPHQVVVMEGQHVTATLTEYVDLHELNAAVDAIYALSWVALAKAVARPTTTEEN